MTQTQVIQSTYASQAHKQRFRVPIAAVNAGMVLLEGIGSGWLIRLCSATAIAIGASATGADSVDVVGTQGGASVKLVSFAQASLTRSTVLTDGAPGAAVLAEGASYAPCDQFSKITLSKSGASLTGATFIDVILTYVFDPVPAGVGS